MTFCKSSCLTHLVIIKLTLICPRYLASVLLPLTHYSFHNEIKAHLYTCYICTPPFHTPSNYSSLACAPYWTIWNLPVLPRRWQFFLVLRHIFTPTTYIPYYTLYISSFLISMHLYIHVKNKQTNKQCLTQRGHDVSLTCPSRLIWTFLWSFHGFTRWWACWKGILALRTKEKKRIIVCLFNHSYNRCIRQNL